MSATTALPLTARERNLDRRFFTGMAVAAVLVVLLGFAPSYCFRTYLRSPARKRGFPWRTG